MRRIWRHLEGVTGLQHAGFHALYRKFEAAFQHIGRLDAWMRVAANRDACLYFGFHEHSLVTRRAVGLGENLPVDTAWGRSRDHQQSATLASLFAEAGLDHDPALLHAYQEFWEPHTRTDPEVAPVWRALRERGIRVGVLSNTIWPREWHRDFFARDGVLVQCTDAQRRVRLPDARMRPRSSLVPP